MKESPVERTLFEKVIESSRIGGSRVIFTFGAGHPFDLVKTQMQANPNITSAVLLSKQIYRKSGIRGFYIGGIPNFSRSLLKETYRSPTRGFMKHNLQKMISDSGNHQDLVNLLTGFGMATIDTFIMCPLERLKVWMMTNYTRNKKISSFFTQMNNSTDLFRQLFMGLKVSYVRNGAAWMSYLVAEEKIRKKIIELSPRMQDSEHTELPLQEKLLIGSLSGIVNLICTHPFDMIKSQVQKYGNVSSKPIFKMMTNIIQKYGLSGLYSGWQVRLPHYIVVGILTSHVLERVDQVWKPVNK